MIRSGEVAESQVVVDRIMTAVIWTEVMDMGVAETVDPDLVAQVALDGVAGFTEALLAPLMSPVTETIKEGKHQNLIFLYKYE